MAAVSVRWGKAVSADRMFLFRNMQVHQTTWRPGGRPTWQGQEIRDDQLMIGLGVSLIEETSPFRSPRRIAVLSAGT